MKKRYVENVKETEGGDDGEVGWWGREGEGEDAVASVSQVPTGGACALNQFSDGYGLRHYHGAVGFYLRRLRSALSGYTHTSPEPAAVITLFL